MQDVRIVILKTGYELDLQRRGDAGHVAEVPRGAEHPAHTVDGPQGHNQQRADPVHERLPEPFPAHPRYQRRLPPNRGGGGGAAREGGDDERAGLGEHPHSCPSCLRRRSRRVASPPADEVGGWGERRRQWGRGTERDGEGKALECFVALRKACIIEQLLSSKNVLLICKEEAPDSDVTEEMARSFFMKTEISSE